jgi:hypothetical protein
MHAEVGDRDAEEHEQRLPEGANPTLTAAATTRDARSTRLRSPALIPRVNAK